MVSFFVIQESESDYMLKVKTKELEISKELIRKTNRRFTKNTTITDNGRTIYAW